MKNPRRTVLQMSSVIFFGFTETAIAVIVPESQQYETNKEKSEAINVEWTKEEIEEGKLPDILKYYETVYKWIFGDTIRQKDKVIHRNAIFFFLDVVDKRKKYMGTGAKCVELVKPFKKTEFLDFLFKNRTFGKLYHRSVNEDRYECGNFIPYPRVFLSASILKELYKKFCSKKESSKEEKATSISDYPQSSDKYDVHC